MADQDTSLDIIIRLLSQTQGADAVQAALNKTKVAATETGKAADFLNPAFANSSKAMSGAAEEAGHLELKHKLLHAAIHQTGAEIPGLSALLRDMFNPVSIGLVGGMTAIHLYFEHLAKVQEKQLEWIKELQKTNDALHEITSAGKSADEQLIDINKALADGQVKAHGMRQEIEVMTGMWKVYEEAVKDAAAAQQQADSDAATSTAGRIEALEKAGLITKESAEQMKNLAAYEAEVSKVRSERAAKNAQYDSLVREKDDALRKRNALGTEEAAQKKLSTDQHDLDRNEEILKSLPKIIEDQKALAREALNKHDIKTYLEQTGMAQKNEDILENAQKQNPALAGAVARDKDNIAAMASLDKTINDLLGQMNVLNQSIADLDKSSREHLDRANHDLDVKQFGAGASDLLKQAEEIARRYQLITQGKAAPNSVSQSEVNEMIRVSEAATGRTQTAKTAMGTMLAAMRNVHVAMSDIERIATVMEQISYALPNNLSNRLAAIEARLGRAHQ